MALTRVLAAATAAILCSAGLRAAALAQTQPCANLLPAASRTVTRRALDSDDLLALRDIGPEFPVGGGHDIFSISPDGRWLAFEIHQAVASSNSYCVGLAVVAIRRGRSRSARLVDRGGDLIPYALHQYGWAALPSGMIMAASPRWAPDGRWVAFLKRLGGVTQVWRAEISGSEATQLTHSVVDVEDYRITNAGRTIVYVARPALVAAAAAIDREALTGWHFDARAYPVRSARPRIPDVAAVRYFAVDTATGAERTATPEETAMFGAPSGVPAVASLVSTGVAGRIAWGEADETEPLSGERRIAARLGDGRIVRCAFDLCVVDATATIWWSRNGKSLFFTRREGWGRSETALYRWSLAGAPPARLYRTDDALVECHGEPDDLICLTEQSARPRSFRRIHLASGRVRDLFDPNPGLCPTGWCRKVFLRRVATVDLLVGFGCELEPGEEDDDR